MTKTIIVTGPPCSGKTTYIRENKGPRDVVIDLDAIAQAIGYPGDHIDHDYAHHAYAYALRARASLIKLTRERSHEDVTVWIIDTHGKTPGDQTVHMDTPLEECHRRADAQNRPPSTHQQINQWAGHTEATRTW